MDCIHLCSRPNVLPLLEQEKWLGLDGLKFNPPSVEKEFTTAVGFPQGKEEREHQITATMLGLSIHHQIPEEYPDMDGTHICHQEMQEHETNTLTIVAQLRLCAHERDSEQGSRLHADIVKMGLLENNTFIVRSLISMYTKCGLLAKAEKLFDMLSVRDLILWSALIGGFVKCGSYEQALDCFVRMQLVGLSPDAVMFIHVLKACGGLKALEKGHGVHFDILRQGLLERDVIIGNALVDMYTKCGMLTRAQEVFDNLHVRDVVLWSTLIAGYAQHGYGNHALHYFDRMQQEGVAPNAVTFVCALKGCACEGDANRGLEIHVKIVRDGLLEKDIFIGNALVDMYAKCGLVGKAQEVFDKLPVRTMVLWSTLIAGYAHEGYGEQALECFEQLQLEGFCPDAVTFLSVLKACCAISNFEKGLQLHAEIIVEGLLEKDIILGNGLVDMYAKCGMLMEAQDVFDDLPAQDLVLWSTLLAGYAHCGHGEKALHIFEQMQREGHSPNSVTLICVLIACSSVGAIGKGQDIHAEILSWGLLDKDILLGTALVDLYAKCGLLARAEESFLKIPCHDIISWNTLIAAKALLGKAESVFDIFNAMIREGLEPDNVTWTLLLNTCNHSGWVDKGLMYFESMSIQGVAPSIDQYTCMVDLLCRAGHLDEAVTIIKGLPFSAGSMMWHTLLSACLKWGNVSVGRLAFDHAMQLDEKDVVAYVCMSNIYTCAGRQHDADKVEAMRVEKQTVLWESSCPTAL